MEGLAVVTGGGSETGKALCLEMMSRGYRIVVSDMDIHQAEMTALEIMKQGGSATAVFCDVMDEDQVSDLVGTTISTYGVPDLVFSSIAAAMPIQDGLTAAQTDQAGLPSSNVFGMWNTAARFAEGAVRAGEPTKIFFTISEYDIGNPLGGGNLYVALKHATSAMAEAMREELRDFPVEISLLCLDQELFHPWESDRDKYSCPEQALGLKRNGIPVS